jgi:hypothetical protein
LFKRFTQRRFLNAHVNSLLCSAAEPLVCP